MLYLAEDTSLHKYQFLPGGEDHANTISFKSTPDPVNVGYEYL